MKMITAYIQPEKLDDVKRELFLVDVRKMSVTNAHGCGQQGGYTENYRGVMQEVRLLKKIRLDVAVNDHFVQVAVDAIIRGARTGNIGDGKIFVMPIEQCYRIRTGEQGNDAIG